MSFKETTEEDFVRKGDGGGRKKHTGNEDGA